MSLNLVEGLKSEGLLDAMVFDSHTPLTFACKAGALLSAESLLRAGADPNALNQWGQPPLMWACESDLKLPLAIALMNAGADIELSNQVGDRPLHTAAFGGHMQIVKELIARGADIEALGQDGWRVIHVACKMGNADLVRLLADRGADLEKRVEQNGKKMGPMEIAMQGAFLSKRSHLECVGHISSVLGARAEAKALAKAAKMAPAKSQRAEGEAAEPSLLQRPRI